MHFGQRMVNVEKQHLASDPLWNDYDTERGFLSELTTTDDDHDSWKYGSLLVLHLLMV